MKKIWEWVYEFKKRLRDKRSLRQYRGADSAEREEGVELKLKSGEVNAPPWIGRGSDTPSERRRDGGKIIKRSNG